MIDDTPATTEVADPGQAQTAGHEDDIGGALRPYVDIRVSAAELASWSPDRMLLDPELARRAIQAA